MAGSTTNLDTISSSQALKEITANALFDAGSPATIYGRRTSTTTALTWGFYGGYISIAGTPTSIANGTVTLTGATTNYVVASRATGAVSTSTTTTNWDSASYIRLYAIVTGTSSVTSYTDHRTLLNAETPYGALQYQGTWDADTNTPTLADGTGTKGYYYAVSVAGTTSLDGIASWSVGDWAIFNGTVWQKLEGGITSGEIVAALGYTPQTQDATLTSLSALGTAADKGIYSTGIDTWAEFDFSAAARTVLDDTTVSAMVDTLGGAASTGTGGLVRKTSPTLVTPKATTTIGVGNATPAASGAGITFPATQSASTDANTLDDYEEGTCTLGITFTTPGDLSVAYIRNSGRYTKIGRLVTITGMTIVTSSFSHTTASGDLKITGLPFSQAANEYAGGGLAWSGITKAGYTDIGIYSIPSSTNIALLAAGSGAAYTTVTAADVPTGGAVRLEFHYSYTT